MLTFHFEVIGTVLYALHHTVIEFLKKGFQVPNL